MNNNNNFQLLPFQEEAVIKTVEAIYSYDPSKNIFTAGKLVPTELIGKPKPYLHRIKAITGSGKTPVLASISAHLKDCIIIWATTRGAVIEQTTESLCGKYRNLLAGDTEVFSLDEAMKNATWNRIIEQNTGCTIITTTVASFNQKDGKNLMIHKGDRSPWQQLCNEVKRPIWILYDEGHNATENQFMKLLELQPKGFILASASPLATDLHVLLPGEDKQAKEAVLNTSRTTTIDTQAVVAAGLLKRTIEIHDLNTGDNKILEAAFKKRKYLEELSGENIIACYIVDKDAGATGVLHGLRIWELLVGLGADPKTIAVHLSGSKKAAEIEVSRGKQGFRQLRATYDEKLGPKDLKDSGFKHLIWNLSLEEGWDEPWAYVGYFHCEQATERRITQRIGRLIRNPFKNLEGQPELPAEEPLRSVYCYLNTPNEVLETVVKQLQSEMDTSSLEILVIKESHTEKSTLSIEPKGEYKIPRLSIIPNNDKLESDLFKAVFKTNINNDAHIAEGKSTISTVTVGSKDEAPQVHSKLEENAPTTIGEVVKNHLSASDSRLIRKKGSTGGWISPHFWQKPEFQKKVYYSSEAYSEYKRRCDEFVDESIDRLISISLDNDYDDPYVVEAIKLINPNGGDTERSQIRYKVHNFKNSVHSCYNGFNDLELKVVKALDKCNVTWARNPSMTGYGIPLIRPGTSTTFYPDFIIWKNHEVFFLEVKGPHLIEETKKEKLKRLPDGLTLGVIAEDLKGNYKLLRRGNLEIHEKTGTLEHIIKELLEL